MISFFYPFYNNFICHSIVYNYALSVAHLVKEVPACMEAESYCCARKIPPLCYIVSPLNPGLIFTHCFSKIDFNIAFHLRLGIEVSKQNVVFLCIAHLPCVCYTSSPSTWR